MTKDFDEIMEALEDEDFLVFHDVDDLLELLHSIMDDDDKPDIKVEITAGEMSDTEEEPETKKSSDEEEVDELRRQAKKQHDEIVELCGKEIADAVVDYAAVSASIAALVRQNVPIKHELVDKYNALTEQLHPESCTPLVKALVYHSIKQMVKEGKESLE